MMFFFGCLWCFLKFYDGITCFYCFVIAFGCFYWHGLDALCCRCFVAQYGPFLHLLRSSQKLQAGWCGELGAFLYLLGGEHRLEFFEEILNDIQENEISAQHVTPTCHQAQETHWNYYGRLGDMNGIVANQILQITMVHTSHKQTQTTYTHAIGKSELIASQNPKRSNEKNLLQSKKTLNISSRKTSEKNIIPNLSKSCQLTRRTSTKKRAKSRKVGWSLWPTCHEPGSEVLWEISSA